MIDNMTFGWEAGIRRVDPYTPGEQPQEENVIKLNTNENPYGPSPRVRKMAEKMNMDTLRKYPDQSATELVEALAAYHGVSSDKVFVGVGSDDVLGMCFLTFFNKEQPILFPEISYSFYPVWAELYRIPYKKLPLKDDFTINADDYMIPNGGIVIANPNAPTSILLGREEVIRIIEANPSSIVIIDEAYIDFAGKNSSVIDLIDKYDNLIVVRTFSKSRSMAGLRIGYAVSNAKVIKYLSNVKYSYNSYTMNYPSILLGSSVIADEDYFVETVEKIKNTRAEFVENLRSLGFKVMDSATNFVFASPDGVGGLTAKQIFEEGKKRKIYLRYFNIPGIENYLRITIGTDDEMRTVYEFLKELLTT